MKINLSNENLEYFDLKIVDTISIVYNLNSYPSCEITVICTESQRTLLENNLETNTLPFFLGYFKANNITFSEIPNYLNPASIYKASISFEYFLMDNLNSNFNLIPRISLNSNSNPTQPYEIGISTKDIKNILLQAPIQNYRFVDIRQNLNFLTTAGNEISYLTSTYGLIINSRKLRKGIIELVPYGKKIAEITIPSDEIISKESSTYSKINYQIPPTIIWRDTFTNLQSNILSSVINNSLTATCFTFSSLADTPVTDFDIDLTDSPENPYHSLNPFAPSYIPPTLSPDNIGILELPLVNNRDYFRVTDFKRYNNSFLDQFSQPLNLNFGRNQLRTTPPLTERGTIITPIDQSGLYVNVSGDSPDLFDPIYLNQEYILQSGDDTFSDPPLANNSIINRSFENLETNGGNTKKRIIQKFKNGQSIWKEIKVYGYKYISFDENAVNQEWGMVEFSKTTYLYKEFQYQGWREKYYTDNGDTTQGWKLYQAYPPQLGDQETLNSFYNSTIGTSNIDDTTEYEQKFLIRQVPFTETRTLEFADLTFLPEYQNTTGNIQRYPLEYIKKETIESDSREFIQIGETVYTIGKLTKRVTSTEFIFISTDLEQEQHRYRVTQTTVNLDSLQGKLGNRVKQTSFNESTGTPPPVSYNPILNPYSFSSGDNNPDSAGGKREYIIFTNNQSSLYNSRAKNVYSEEILPVKDYRDAIKTFLSLKHLELIKSNYVKTLIILGNANIYPADTIKYRWYGNTEGGLVLSVNNSLQILPNNTCKWITTITYSDYDFNLFTSQFTNRNRRYS